MKITTIGLDLAKNVFQLHGVDAHGKVVQKKQLKRWQMAEFFANLPPCTIGMEACLGSHYWARLFAAQYPGHHVHEQGRSGDAAADRSARAGQSRLGRHVS